MDGVRAAVDMRVNECVSVYYFTKAKQTKRCWSHLVLCARRKPRAGPHSQKSRPLSAVRTRRRLILPRGWIFVMTTTCRGSCHHHSTEYEIISSGGAKIQSICHQRLNKYRFFFSDEFWNKNITLSKAWTEEMIFLPGICFNMNAQSECWISDDVKFE